MNLILPHLRLNRIFPNFLLAIAILVSHPAPQARAGICDTVSQFATKIYDYFLGPYEDIPTRYLSYGHRIGGGGFGHVFAGKSRGRVVLTNGKIINPGDGIVVKVARQEDLFYSKQSIQNEIKMGRLLRNQCDCFLGIEDSSDQHQIYVVQEFVQNSKTLDGFLAPQNLNDLGDRFHSGIIANFGKQLEHALKILEKNNIVHGDLNPSNILVTEIDGQWKLKIIDFGGAAFVGKHPLYNRDQRGLRMGTIGFAEDRHADHNAAEFSNDRYAVSKIMDMMYDALLVQKQQKVLQ